MTRPIPMVLALGYYDGATEGYFNGMGDELVYFFKVVAWDQNQDRRLFLLGQVDIVAYSELVEVLKKTQQAPAGAIWTPSWMFGDSELEARANNIVETSRRSLDTATLLVLGEDLAGSIEVLHPNAKGLLSALALAHEGNPGDLATWVAHSM